MTRDLHSRAPNSVRKRRLVALFGSTALAVAGLAAGSAKAGDIWNGTGSNDWFTAGNWTPNAVPIATDDVFIGVIAPNPTTINAAGALAFTLSVGDPTGGASGALTISGAGGLLVSQNSFIGRTAGTSGVVTVTGAGATWNTSIGVYIGDVGNGQVSLLSGGHASNVGATIGDFAGSVGTLTIDGAGSLWTSTNNVVVGGAGQGTLTITNGGQLTADQTYAGGSATGVITVDGAGSQITDNTTIQIGNTGVGGQLNITNGGAVMTTNAAVGAGAAGQANVTGAGSTFTVSNDLSVGAGGVLTISNGSAVSVATNGTGVTGTGVINIGAGMGSAAAAPGAYTTATLFLGSAASSIVFNHTSASYSFAGPIQGSGTVFQQAGVTHLTGNSQFFAGSAVVNGGTLLVDNSFGGTISVASGGTLGGNSSSFVLGAVSVAGGGTLLGAQGSTFTAAAALTLGSGSVLNVTLGAPGSVTPLFSVGANLTLDGTLNITNAAGFGPGLYRLINYSGALTDNTLDIGSVPGGATAAQYAVQTGTVHQVNLLYSGAAPPPPPPPPPVLPPAPPAPVGPFSIWNVGASVAGVVTSGGTGVWSANSNTFANAAGTANAPLTASPGFPIFAGTAGVVTVDLSAGPVQVSGLQFATSNYLITGGAVVLNPGLNTLRVGDGTAAGVGFVGSIASSLTGAGGLDKNDLGTLILSGANSYTGATRVSAGVLVLADGGSIAASSGLTDNATFDISGAASGASVATLSGSGAVVLGAQTLTLTNASGDFSGAIGGAGGLAVTGGAQVLSGANSFTGGVAIGPGASLALGDGGTSGAVVGPVVDNGALILNRSDAVTVASAISGAGDVAQTGLGVATLAGLNTYAGGTTISAGGLAGSATSFGSGAILDNGALTLTQATDGAMANRLDGSGVFTKTGAGGLSLTGGGGLTGGITLAAGRLSIDSDFSHTPVTVNAGVLGGVGAIGALTVNGGIVQPGDAPSSAGQATTRSSANPAASGARASAAASGIGSLTVAGDYSQASGAILRLQVGATAASQLSVTGVATLAPGAILQLAPVGAGPYTIGARMLAFSAAGGMQGRFTLDTGGPVSPFLGFTASYVGDDIYLSLTKLSSFAAAGATANQRAAAAGADSLTVTQPVMIALAGLQSDAAAQGAFDQLSGEAHASAITTEFEDSRFLRDAVADRMGESVSRAGSAWAKVIGAWGATGSDGDAARLSRSSAGLMFGADRALSDTWRAGLIGGYARTQESVADRSSSAIAQNLSVGGYVGGRFDRLTFSAALAQTWTSLDMSRTVAFPGFAGRVTGGPGLEATQLFGEAAYGLNLPGQQAQLFSDLAAVNVHSQSGSEDGGAAALTIRGKSQAIGFATFGLKDSVRLNAQGLTAEATLAWRHAQGDVTPSSTQSFSGGSDFTVQGAPVGRDALVLKAAMGGEIAPRLAVQLGYSGQFSRSAGDQDVKLNLSLRF